MNSSASSLVGKNRLVLFCCAKKFPFCKARCPKVCDMFVPTDGGHVGLLLAPIVNDSSDSRCHRPVVGQALRPAHRPLVCARVPVKSPVVSLSRSIDPLGKGNGKYSSP